MYGRNRCDEAQTKTGTNPLAFNRIVVHVILLEASSEEGALYLIAFSLFIGCGSYLKILFPERGPDIDFDDR